MSAPDFVQRAAEGDLDTSGVIVRGDVDFHELDRVSDLVRCMDCTISGSLTAADVTFDRVVDLSGLHVSGGVDLHGATMHSAFLMNRSPERSVVIRGPTDMSHLVVDGPAVFDGAEFHDKTQLDGLGVTGPASFTGAQFHRPLTLSNCLLGGNTTFAGAQFHETAHFSRCEFADTSSFRSAIFRDATDFNDTTFAASTDFALADFHDTAVLRRARFGGPASFRLVDVRESLSLQHVHATQELDLQGATIAGQADLHSAAVDGLLTLTDIKVADEGASIVLEQVAATGVLVDIDTVEHVPGAEVKAVVLADLERTAQERNDLALANNARYALLSLQSAELSSFQRALDGVFYRGVAGYLVQPVHPLLCLLTLMVLAGFVRTVVELGGHSRGDAGWNAANRSSDQPRKRSPQLRRVGPALGRGFGCTIRSVVRRRPGIKVEDEETMRAQFVAAGLLGEYLVYKALLVLVLIAVGSSSPRVRELLDALRT